MSSEARIHIPGLPLHDLRQIIQLLCVPVTSSVKQGWISFLGFITYYHKFRSFKQYAFTTSQFSWSQGNRLRVPYNYNEGTSWAVFSSGSLTAFMFTQLACRIHFLMPRRLRTSHSYWLSAEGHPQILEVFLHFQKVASVPSNTATYSIKPAK